MRGLPFLASGDTGSQALGALIATAGLLSCQQACAGAGGSAWGAYALLGSLSLVYALESASVLLQVGFFRYTKRAEGIGRRFFRHGRLYAATGNRSLLAGQLC